MWPWADVDILLECPLPPPSSWCMTPWWYIILLFPVFPSSLRIPSRQSVSSVRHSMSQLLLDHGALAGGCPAHCSGCRRPVGTNSPTVPSCCAGSQTPDSLAHRPPCGLEVFFPLYYLGSARGPWALPARSVLYTLALCSPRLHRGLHALSRHATGLPCHGYHPLVACAPAPGLFTHNAGRVHGAPLSHLRR